MFIKIWKGDFRNKMKEKLRIIKKIEQESRHSENHVWTRILELYNDGLICYEELDNLYPEFDEIVEIPRRIWSKIFKLKDTK